MARRQRGAGDGLSYCTKARLTSWLAACAGFFLTGFLRTGLAGLARLGRGLDLFQPAGLELIDARPVAGEIAHHDLAFALLVGADIDVVGRAGAAHHLAFGHAERDAAPEHRGGRGGFRLEPVGQRRRPRRRGGADRHGRAGEIAGDGADRTVGGRRRRLGRDSRRDGCGWRRGGNGHGFRRAAAVGGDQIFGRDRTARPEMDIVVAAGRPLRRVEGLERFRKGAAIGVGVEYRAVGRAAARGQRGGADQPDAHKHAPQENHPR